MMETLFGALVTARGRGWADNAVAGALAFWCLGIIAATDSLRSLPTVARCAQDTQSSWCLPADADGAALVAAAVLALLGVLSSAALVRACTLPAVTVLAGHGWPQHWLGRWLGETLVARQRRNRARLWGVGLGTAPPATTPVVTAASTGHADRGATSAPRPSLQRGRRGPELSAVAVAQAQWYPLSDASLKPTRLGNAFTAVAERIRHRHGLDLSTCWPVLMQVMPGPARARIEAQSEQVSRQVQNLLWVLACLVWMPLLPRALAWTVVLIVAALTRLLWWSLAGTVEQYCALIEAAVLTSRRLLYEGIGWPLPRTAAEEPSAGRAVTDFLTRRAQVGAVVYQWPDAADE
jgi:hypothetical protein